MPRDKWVLVTTAWRVFRLRMEEQPQTWRVAANILNKQSRTAYKGWSSSLRFGRGANNSSLLKCILLRNVHRQSLGPALILGYNLSNTEITTLISVPCRGAQNPGDRQRVTNFVQQLFKICGPSVWNLLHVTYLASRIFRWLRDF